MNFRTTAFDPMDGQQLRQNDPTVDFASMEKNLAREMARMKITDEKKRREVEKVCAESDELKELQAKIKAAYLNKERAAQIAEGQYRKQTELVSYIIFKFLTFYSFKQEADANVEMEMLRRKELADQAQRAAAAQKQDKLYAMKKDVQAQMIERE